MAAEFCFDIFEGCFLSIIPTPFTILLSPSNILPTPLTIGPFTLALGSEFDAHQMWFGTFTPNAHSL